MRILFLTILLIVSIGIIAYANDPGARDSVIVVDAQIPNTGAIDTFFVDIAIVADDSVAFYNIPLDIQFSESGITYDRSFGDTAGVEYGSQLSSWDDVYDLYIDSDNMLRLIGFNDIGGGDNIPLYSNVRLNIMRLRFITEANTVSQYININSTTDPFNGDILFGLAGGIVEFAPVFKPGVISFGFPTGTDDVESMIPESFALHQNYPNPFNPQTNISFSLPSDENVRISVFNLLGQQVKTIADAYFTAGTHTVLWNGTNQNGSQVPSGIYFYSINAGEFAKTNKMILIR